MDVQSRKQAGNKQETGIPVQYAVILAVHVEMPT